MYPARTAPQPWAPALPASDRHSLCGSACRHPKTSRPHDVQCLHYYLCVLTPRGQQGSTYSKQHGFHTVPSARDCSSCCHNDLIAQCMGLSTHVPVILHESFRSFSCLCFVPCVDTPFVFPSSFLKGFGLFLVLGSHLKPSSSTVLLRHLRDFSDLQ